MTPLQNAQIYLLKDEVVFCYSLCMFGKIEEYFQKNFWAAPLFIAIITICTFIPSLPNEFVLDDPSQVANNVLVTSGNIPRIFLGSSFGVTGSTKGEGVYYKPLMTSSYSVLYQVFGKNPYSFHLYQILLHTINSILVFLLFKKFFKQTLSFIVAVIFSIHPFNSESVLYVSALQEPLFFVFGMTGFLLSTKVYLSKKNVTLISSLFLLAILSKETGVLFITMAILYRLIIEKDRKELFKLLAGIIPMIVGYSFLRSYAVGFVPTSHDKPYPIMRLSLLERILNIPAMFYYYIRNFFVPYDFAVAQHWVVKKLTFQTFYLPLTASLLFFSAIGLVFKYLRDKKNTQLSLFIFFFLWFFIGMAAHMNIFPLDVTTADRWFYFPIVGLLGMMSIALRFFRTERKNAFIWACIVVSLIFFTRSVMRATEWRDGITLDLHDIQFSKDSFPLENNLAYELINKERYAEAEIHARKSTELGSWWWLNWNNLGVIYRHKGSKEDPKYFTQAEEYFLKAANNTTFYLPYENLAELLVNYDSPSKAQEFIIKVSRKMPLSGMLWFDLALAQLQLNDTKGALQAAEQAKLILPNDERINALYNGIKNNQKILMVKPTY